MTVKLFRRWTWGVVVSLGLVATGAIVEGIAAPSALAAQQVVLRYRIFQASVSVADLAQLAETGQASTELQGYLRLANQNPQQVQRVLNEGVDIDLVRLDRLLNSALGDVALDQLSRVISTPSGRADRQALRSALILSASNNNRISLIEVLQNYPTEVVVINGNELVTAQRQIRQLQGQAESVVGGARQVERYVRGAIDTWNRLRRN